MTRTGGALLALSLALPGFARGSGPCGCDDLNNIQRRLLQVKYLIKAFTDVYLDPANAHAPWTFSAWESVSNPIDQQLGQQVIPYPANYSGQPQSYTDFHCNIKLPDNVPACILESLRIHETVHKLACEISARHPTHPFVPLVNWQNDQTIADAAKEDIDAYGAEAKYLEGEKHRLLCTCPYFGIRVEARTDVNSSLVQASTNYTPGGSGPLVIPLTLNADGTFNGAVTATTTQKATDASCREQAESEVKFEAVGFIGGKEKATQMNLDISKSIVEAGSGNIKCPQYSHQVTPQGGEGAASFNLQASLGQSQTVTLPLPTPGAIPSVTAKIVPQPALESQIAAAFPTGGAPAIFLPNCRNQP